MNRKPSTTLHTEEFWHLFVKKHWSLTFRNPQPYSPQMLATQDIDMTILRQTVCMSHPVAIHCDFHRRNGHSFVLSSFSIYGAMWLRVTEGEWRLVLTKWCVMLFVS